MNSPLFSPLAAANNTVSLATGTAGCGNLAPAPGDDVAAFLTSSTIITNLVSEPEESAALFEAILADPSAEPSIEGDELIGSQLSALPVSGSPGAPTFANASATTMTWIAELAELSAGWASNLNPTDDARRRLMGQPRTVDQLQTQVNAFAASHGLDITTYQVEARFGLYGALPIVVATYKHGGDEGALLIDGVNGNLDGPFSVTSAIAPQALLSSHTQAFILGSAITSADSETGCVVSWWKKWRPAPPPGYIPRTPCPACTPPTWTPPGTPIAPFPAFPVTPNPSLPGWQANPVCVQAVGGCSCATYGHVVSPTGGGGLVPMRIVCTAAVCPVPPQPASLPAAGMTCTTEYYH